MRRIVLALLALGLVWGTAWIRPAEASLCGAGRHCHCACQTSCCWKTITVMKTCQETVYDEQEQTFYKTVYEDVVEKKSVPCVQWVEETRYRCCPCTIMQPEAKPAAPACAPVNSGCGGCAQPVCEKMVPVTICRKVPYTVCRQTCVESQVEHLKVVAKQVPFTVTICIPRVITKQVPVEVCCPVPCSQCESCGCGK